MQLKTYFFVPFVRPYMHLNYGVISGCHACSSGLSECAGCAKVCKTGASIFILRALRGPPFFGCALSKFYEIFLMIVFLVYANDYTIKFNLLSSRLLLIICFNTFGFLI